MNRLHKKCLFASITMHVLLALLLIVGPAFLTRKPEPFNLPQLSFIPTRTVDALLYRDGNPAAKSPPAAPAPQPEPVRPQPVPPPSSAQTQPAPEKIQPPPRAQRTPERTVPEAELRRPGNDPTAKPASRKPNIRVNPNLSKRESRATNPPKPRNAAPVNPRVPTDEVDATVQRQLRSQLKTSIGGIVQNLTDTLSSGTTIDIPGPGGEAFANYGQVVVAIYQRNWIKPSDIEGSHVVKTTVVIAREGRVLSARITLRCGNPAVDRSVADLLDRVTFVEPFPEGAKDESRTFTIEFELNPRSRTG